MIKSLIKIIIIFATGFSIAQGESAGKYHYYSYGEEGFFSSITIDVSKSAVYVGHAGRRARICGVESDMYCIDSPVISFYVPKNGVVVGAKWRGGNHVFEVARADTILLLGVRIDCLVITTEGGAYYYSQNKGLIGFSIRDKTAVTTYLGRKSFGFPVQGP